MEIDDLAGLGKAVKTVTSAVRGAVSTLYRPSAIRNEGRARADTEAYRIETLARAEAAAAIIKNEGALELAERAKQRFVFEQVKQQESLDKIFQKAIEYSKENNNEGRDISEHWLYRLIINAKDVTNEEIQEIFAKLIVEQGSAAKKPISFMTLDALRLFEPRHAEFFKQFCRLYYLFGGVYFGINDSNQWFGDEEFAELIELGIVTEHSIPSDTRAQFRDFTIELNIKTPSENGFGFIFGGNLGLSLRGIELSKVLYPDVASQYWHSLRKDLSKKVYEKILAGLISEELQFETFEELIALILDDEDCKLAILVHKWDEPYYSSKAKPYLRFDGKWTQSKTLPGYFVPKYLAKFAKQVTRKTIA